MLVQPSDHCPCSPPSSPPLRQHSVRHKSCYVTHLVVLGIACKSRMQLTPATPRWTEVKVDLPSTVTHLSSFQPFLSPSRHGLPTTGVTTNYIWNTVRPQKTWPSNKAWNWHLWTSKIHVISNWVAVLFTPLKSLGSLKKYLRSNQWPVLALKHCAQNSSSEYCPSALKTWNWSPTELWDLTVLYNSRWPTKVLFRIFTELVEQITSCIVLWWIGYLMHRNLFCSNADITVCNRQMKQILFQQIAFLPSKPPHLV